MDEKKRVEHRAAMVALRDSIDWSQCIAPGLVRNNFDHKTCLDGLRLIWGLLEEDVQAILTGAVPNSEEWMRRIELLFQLKGTLAGLKSGVELEERLAYENLWLREPRKIFKNESPLQILKKGDAASIDSMLAVLQMSFVIDVPI